ncbi:hypothetical protein PT974_02447 [Cladobotryum mycophilum]|uniref:BHLH domain-containing protein n=1 Tax=Cladobotryum mycophilum TaxID=491253 RepID=A0ABR0SZA0_9HYPO
MGSTQPESDPFLPFGYTVDPNQEPLFDAPEPAPGAPLLSDTDNKFLSSFFEDMTANQYNMPSFGEGLNFSDVWLDLPPQFMGTATSFGPQSTTSLGPEVPQSYPGDLELQGMLPGSHLMPPPPPPPPPQPSVFQQSPSDDVLNAAATLLQNGSGSRSITKTTDASPPRRPIGPPVGHLRHQPLEEFKEESRKGMGQEQHENMFNEWMWGSKDRQASRSTLATDYQWGSDASFGHSQGFSSEINKEAAESMQQEQLKCLDCLEPSKSAATTRPGSPIANGHGAFSIAGGRDMPELVHKRTDEGEAPPRKRRKSKNQREAVDDEEDDDSTAPKSARRRKPKAERNASMSGSPKESGGAAKRRKSTAAGTKPPRENLSEEQKRENHIRSEQKRRTLIKEGFDDLCDLVPGLRGGGFSKSTMLAMTAEWLEELLRGNSILSTQLTSIEAR